MIVCSIATNTYLSRFSCLLSSLRRFHADAIVFLCQPERELHPIAQKLPVHAVRASDLYSTDFWKVPLRQSMAEVARAIRPRLIQRAFDMYPQESLLFALDSDMTVEAPLVEATDLISRSDIVVTPHYIQAQVSQPATDLFFALSRGTYNAGFMGLRRTPVASDFLAWWQEKSESFYGSDTVRGLYYEQKWLDAAAAVFPLTVLDHPGYNVGYWNIRERSIRWSGHRWQACGQALRCMHWAGFTWCNADRRLAAAAGEDTVFQLYGRHRRRARRVDRLLNDAAHEWTYDKYVSGESVDAEVRFAARSNPRILDTLDSSKKLSNELLFTAIVSHRTE
jgi:hypothetical protein